jgi:hypothetical protein
MQLLRTDLYAEADKVISLSGTNSGIIGLGKRAGSDRGAPRPQQRDNGFSQRPYDGTTQSRKREQIAKKRSNLNTSGQDVVCSKCHNKGHTTANCRSSWTKEGKFIGTGEPPPAHYWTQRHAAELKQKKAAMIKKTPPQQTPPQQQQQQPAQRQKRKKTVQAITLADPSAATVLEALCNSEASTFTDAEENFPVAPVDERTVGLSVRTNKLNSKVTAWDIDSEELDLQKWTLTQRNKPSQKPEEPKT